MGPIWNAFILTVTTFSILGGCFGSDPREVRGALDAAARAIEADDGAALYHVIDERSRHALISIVAQRRRAAELIRADYPAEQRAAALAALGDAATVPDAASLFAKRCDRSCRRDIEQRLGAPVSERRDGDELVVTTTTGQQLRLYLGSDTWYGLVWRTQELDHERTRAAQEMTQVAENAATYRRRRSLARTSSGNESGQPASGRSR